MPIIPDLQQASGDWRQSSPDTSSAAALGGAMVSVGRAVMDVADAATSIGMKIKAVREADAKNRARMEFVKAMANHSEFRLRNLDQTTWAGNLQSEIAAARSRLGDLNVGPTARHEIESEWQAWSAEHEQQTHLDATKFEITRARQNVTNLRETYMQAGDFESARKVAHQSPDLYTPEQLAEMDNDVNSAEKIWKTKAEEDAQNNHIAANPAAALIEYEANPPAANATDEEKAKHNRLLLKARQAQAANDRYFTDRIMDGMTSVNGKTPAITTPEQIDQMGADVSPSVREELKGVLLKRNSDANKAWAARPENQSQLVAEANTAITAYDPANPESFDAGYVKIVGIIDQLTPGPVKDELDRRLKAVKEGRLSEQKGALDHAIDTFEEAHKNGGFGGGKADTGERSMTVTRAVNDGFLRDDAKMKGVGFSDDQIKEMQAASDYAKKSLATGEKWSSLPKSEQYLRGLEAADKARQDWMSRNWTFRADKNASPKDPAEIAIAEAIANGQTTAKWLDHDAAAKSTVSFQESQKRKGEAIQKLIEWHKLNPNATQSEIETKVYEFAGAAGRKAWNGSRIPKIPSGGVSMAVPSGGIKLSNYGYRDDKTPDSNSASGIGHSNNRLVDEVSAAVTKSLADRLGLKNGDKFVIETTLGSRVVSYDDTVPSTDKRTGDLPETIDIYRKNGSNSWGGRVLGIRKL